ncbi:MAG: AtpZ/AtpI family protein [Lachnospiraceae bacterium]|nr:AtpZ/AtpI family protein [Lachnospiraceae bacterium]
MEDKDHKVLKSFVMITQISVNMMVPIFLCAALGVWLNRLLGTDVCFLVLVFIGIGASFRNVYILTKSFYSADMKKEHDRIKYIQELKDYSSSPGEKEEYKEIVKTKRYPENKGPARK